MIEVFEKIFYQIYQQLSPFLPDSRLRGSVFKKLIIIDSTTIRLFQEILKAAGRQPADGKRKGGVKVHLSMKATEDVPNVVMISSAATNDAVFLNKLQCTPGSYVVFDKAYNNFGQFHKWNSQKVNWVTRLRSNTIVNKVSSRKLNSKESKLGVRKDEEVIIGHKSKKIQKVKCRLVTFYDQQNKREFSFLTNNFRIKASTVAAIYKQRWQIELLFKRMKQSLQFQYFLGDNENAIRIQIWCSLISDLLIKVVMDKMQTKRKWSFANLSGLIRIHLGTYINLWAFLKNPEKSLLNYKPPDRPIQTTLF